MMRLGTGVWPKPARLRGERERALEELGRGLALGHGQIRHILDDPDFESLRGDAEFQRLTAAAPAAPSGTSAAWNEDDGAAHVERHPQAPVDDTIAGAAERILELGALGESQLAHVEVDRRR